MKKDKTIETLQGKLLENRKRQNEIYRRKKKIVIFSFFSFLFALGISFLLYKFSATEIEFNQNINSDYVDNVVYLSNSNFEKELDKNKNKENKTDVYSKVNSEFTKQYVVQLGVFKDLDNADKFKKKLEKKGYNIYYEKNESYYRIRLQNTFSTRADAEKYADNLKEIKIIEDYWVRLK